MNAASASTMHLVMFDVDGTLSDTMDIERFFVQAVDNVLSIQIDEDWASYKHVTDSGILDEILQRQRILWKRECLSRSAIRSRTLRSWAAG